MSTDSGKMLEKLIQNMFQRVLANFLPTPAGLFMNKCSIDSIRESNFLFMRITAVTWGGMAGGANITAAGASIVY